MPRPKRRPVAVDTLHFEDVSPMWVPPRFCPVPDCYYDAVHALADWIGQDWPDQKRTGFFRIRDDLIGIAETWRHHDWNAEARQYHQAKARLASREKLRIAYRSLIEAHASLEDEDAEAWLAGMLLNSVIGNENAKALLAGMTLNLVVGDEIAAVDHATCAAACRDALKAMPQALALKTQRNGRYGPLEMRGFPSNPPDRAVAVGILMADRITCLRLDIEGETAADRAVRQSRWNGVVPRISRDLPWKAIGLFAFIGPDGHSYDGIELGGFQARVEKARRRVLRVYLRPID